MHQEKNPPWLCLALVAAGIHVAGLSALAWWVDALNREETLAEPNAAEPGDIESPPNEETFAKVVFASLQAPPEPNPLEDLTWEEPLETPPPPDLTPPKPPELVMSELTPDFAVPRDAVLLNPKPPEPKPEPKQQPERRSESSPRRPASSSPSPSQSVEPQAETRPGPSTASTPAPRGRPRMPSPSYPYRARVEGLEGTVVLAIRIGPDGRVTGVRVVSSSGHRVLDEATATHVRRRWRRPDKANQTIRESIEYRLR